MGSGFDGRGSRALRQVDVPGPLVSRFRVHVVRLKPGDSLSQAQAEVSALAASLSSAYPDTNRGVSATVLPPWRAHSGTGDLLLSPLRILMAVALVLLLIVCANVANLLLARSVARYKEFGLRRALGASVWRVVRQLMTETFLLAILGTLAGLILMPWMWNALLALVPDIGLPIARDVEMSGRIAVFAALCCLLAALAAGATPALFAGRANLNQVLKEGGRSGINGAVTHRTRSVLVIAEVALAAVALVAAAHVRAQFSRTRGRFAPASIALMCCWGVSFWKARHSLRSSKRHLRSVCVRTCRLRRAFRPSAIPISFR